MPCRRLTARCVAQGWLTDRIQQWTVAIEAPMVNK
jgi:hypothetical protein